MWTLRKGWWTENWEWRPEWEKQTDAQKSERWECGKWGKKWRGQKMRNMTGENKNKWAFHKNQSPYSLWSVTDIMILN